MPVMPLDTAPQSDQKAVRQLLGRINDAWLKGPPEEIARALEECFREDAAIRGAGFQEMGRGSVACIASYQDFARAAKIRQCHLGEPMIDLYGNTAVAAYSWEMTYSLDGREYQESGHDLFVLTRTQGRWQAAWRALLPAATATT